METLIDKLNKKVESYRTKNESYLPCRAPAHLALTSVCI